MIRSLRHRPPKHAEGGERKLMFSAATEQSEQFFKLSDAAGYETKPILLYYGLNQAARAIAASVAEGEQKWELVGHGIKCPSLNAALSELLVVNAGRKDGLGAFEALAVILNSTSLPREVSVRDVWMSLPDAAKFPLHDTEAMWGAAKLKRSDGKDFLAAFAPSSGSEFEPVVSLSHLPYKLASMEDLSGVIELLRATYPPLRNFVPGWVARHNTLSFDWSPAERLSLGMAYCGDDEPYDGSNVLWCGMPCYGDTKEVSTWMMPVIGGNPHQMHPLITWWAVLFPLSMLARYEFRGWAEMLDIDLSPDAAAIEYLLDRAHLACVNLILWVFVDKFRRVGWVPNDLEEVLRRRIGSFLTPRGEDIEEG